jgi:hypothetical protein
LSRSGHIPKLAQSWELGMNDLLVVGLTIVIFAVFFLLVKAVEHIER